MKRSARVLTVVDRTRRSGRARRRLRQRGAERLRRRGERDPDEDRRATPPTTTSGGADQPEEAADVAGDRRDVFAAGADDLAAIDPPEEVADLHEQLDDSVRTVAEDINARPRTRSRAATPQQAAAGGDRPADGGHRGSDRGQQPDRPDQLRARRTSASRPHARRRRPRATGSMCSGSASASSANFDGHLVIRLSFSATKVAVVDRSGDDHLAALAERVGDRAGVDDRDRRRGVVAVGDLEAELRAWW